MYLSVNYCSTKLTALHILCCKNTTYPLVLRTGKFLAYNFVLVRRLVCLLVPRFLVGATASNAFAWDSVNFAGSWPLSIRAFFFESVTYGPYGPFKILILLANSLMFFAASLTCFASNSSRASASVIVRGSSGLIDTKVLSTCTYGPNRPILALISCPSAVEPTIRGNSNIDKACSSVTVSIVRPVGIGAKAGFFVSSSVSPRCSIGP